MNADSVDGVDLVDGVDGVDATAQREFADADCCREGSVLAGTFDIDAIETAFFNHDNDGGEPQYGEWEARRKQWCSFKAYLAKHPRQEVSDNAEASGRAAKGSFAG